MNTTTNDQQYESKQLKWMVLIWFSQIRGYLEGADLLLQNILEYDFITIIVL